LRHDRPLFLLREIELTPGSHRIRLTLVRRGQNQSDGIVTGPASSSASDTGVFAGRGQREQEERTRGARAAIPSYLALDTTLTFSPGQVSVVWFHSDRRAFGVIDDAHRRR
jgi:hypothetical protein